MESAKKLEGADGTSLMDFGPSTMFGFDEFVGRKRLSQEWLSYLVLEYCWAGKWTLRNVGQVGSDWAAGGEIFWKRLYTAKEQGVLREVQEYR